MTTDLILGTAGHIDHGKTTLIRALTGTETDRLPEEKERGITIELGYACLDLPPFRLGIVDVPGHEKFVRQMLAGASGMDLAMLVIAGDDSVNQQTREHLAILKLLDLATGVIVLTKCDLCEPDWLDLVEEEVRRLVQGTFLESAPIIRTSVPSNLGISELKTALLDACHQAQASRALLIDSPFRMAIDRAFSMEGHGTIVTGSVSSGTLNVGDTLEIQPGQVTARVKSLQNYDQETEVVHQGQRAAINLTGIDLREVQRGHELSAPGLLQPTRWLTVRLEILAESSLPIKHRDSVRLHIGTAELGGQIHLLEASQLSPGEQGLAQFFLQAPTAAVWNQPFVIRRPSPVETIGGGRVLDPNPKPLRKPTANELAHLSELDDDDLLTRALAAIYFSDLTEELIPRLSAVVGVNCDESLLNAIRDSGQVVEIAMSPTRKRFVHRDRIAELSNRVLEKLHRMHDQHPLRFSHPRVEVQNLFRYLSHSMLFDLAIDELVQNSQIVANRESISAVGCGPQLSKGQKALLADLVGRLKSAGIEVPSVNELKNLVSKNKDSVEELLELGCANEQLFKIADELYLHTETVSEIKKRLTQSMEDANGLTLSEIRQVLETSRKYAIPICETFDEMGFTRREGDKRFLSSSIN